MTEDRRQEIRQLARYQVRREALERCLAAIREFVAFVRAKEPGTRRYEVWQEQEDPTRFVHIFVFRDAKADRIHSEDSAWDGELMVGIARSLTDFSYVAYLSDLAVRESHQRLGIATDLIRQTRAALGPRSMFVLLAAPAAVDCYPRVGFSHHPQAWILRAGEPLGGERQPGQKTPI